MRSQITCYCEKTATHWLPHHVGGHFSCRISKHRGKVVEETAWLKELAVSVVVLVCLLVALGVSSELCVFLFACVQCMSLLFMRV